MNKLENKIPNLLVFQNSVKTKTYLNLYYNNNQSTTLKKAKNK